MPSNEFRNYPLPDRGRKFLRKIVITAAHRTPIGSFPGAFADVPAVTLGATVAREVLRDIEGKDLSDVLTGNVLQAGQGMNPGRQIALEAELPVSVPGQTINRVCGSGMQAVISAVQAIRAGDGRIYLAGGVENMSRAPFLVQQMRRGQKLGEIGMIDSMAKDGLTDPAHFYHMGITAENVAKERQISREDQDAFALESHRRATLAQNNGVFDAEIVPVFVPSRKGPIVTDRDEGVRVDSSLESLARCVDSALTGLGPSASVPLVLVKAGLKLDDIGLFELNEAFAAHSLAVCRDLKSLRIR